MDQAELFDAPPTFQFRSITMQNEGLGIVREYVRKLFQHKGKLLLYNLLVLALAIGALLVWPREYRSEAKVWIKIGRENSKLDPTAATGETISIQESDREDEIKSVIDILGSRGVVEQAVALLGEKVVLGDEPLPGAEEEEAANPITDALKNGIGSVIDVVKQIDPIDDHEEAVQEIVKHMVVDAERKSNVVSVYYDTDSPALAQAIVSAIVESYRQEHARIHKTEGSKSFFVEQLDELDERVNETSASLRDAKDEFGLASIGGHRNLLESQLKDVSGASMVAQSKLAESKAMAMELERQLALQPSVIVSEERTVPNTGRDLIQNQLYNLQLERARLESQSKRSDPRVKAILKQEQEAKRELADQTTSKRSESATSVNQIYQELTMELAKVKSTSKGFQSTIEELTSQRGEIMASISELNGAEIDIQRLERQVQLAVKNYNTYADKLEDSRIDEALNQRAISNVSVAQAPTLQQKPVSPSKLIVGLLTLAAMGFGTISILAAAVMTDDSVQNADDLQELVEDVPIVISVPNQRQYRHVLN